MTVAHAASDVALPVATPELYEGLRPAERYIHVSRDRALLDLLRAHGGDLSRITRAIEVGCGTGSLMETLCHYGAEARRLVGIDVRAVAVRQAHWALPDAAMATADAARLPFAANTFDLAFAFTSFSSMLVESKRRAAAAEAMRVLRPGGLLVIYDFWTNPTNRRVHPVGAQDLRRLFAPAHVDVRRVTLAPPITRVLRAMPAACAALERLPFLRTHLLAAVNKGGD